MPILCFRLVVALVALVVVGVSSHDLPSCPPALFLANSSEHRGSLSGEEGAEDELRRLSVLSAG